MAPAKYHATFHAANPATGEALGEEYPVSDWSDIDAALSASVEAAAVLRRMPGAELSRFLVRFAERLEARAGEIVEMAHLETALPRAPRLQDVELPRTTGQLRKAAAAAMEGSWALPTIDTKLNIRSCHAALGPVCVFGPNNFPLAYNPMCGGDFAAAIAAGNPVIGKGHPAHPGTTRIVAEEAFAAVGESGLPRATVQLIYHTSSENGTRQVGDRRVGASGFTGSRVAGLALKAAADAAGKPIYLEMSSLNPVVILPGALKERSEKIAGEFADSCLGAAGQFCTKPGVAVVIAGEASERFMADVRGLFEGRAAGTLLSAGVARSLRESLKTLRGAGAGVVAGGEALSGMPVRFANTLLRVEGEVFLRMRSGYRRRRLGMRRW